MTNEAKNTESERRVNLELSLDQCLDIRVMIRAELEKIKTIYLPGESKYMDKKRNRLENLIEQL